VELRPANEKKDPKPRKKGKTDPNQTPVEIQRHLTDSQLNGYEK
jgi:hypothetical protein